MTSTVEDNLATRLAGQLAGFQGEIITPADPAYDQARQLWNGMIDKRPGVILRPVDVDDVVRAVNVSRANGISPAVRGGGHSVSGRAMSEGGITIDLRNLRQVTVDAENHLAHVGGGCLLGDVDAATGPVAQIVPAGIMSETGVAGLSLGGGIGWFSRKHGLTCDNFVSLEVVLASGEVVEASETSHPDLFWALRGGGGAFGIVTRFTYRTYDFGPEMRIGVSLYQPEDAAEALRAYAKIYPTLGRDVGWHAAFKPQMSPLPFVPAELVGKPLLMLIGMYLEDAHTPEGVELIDRLTGVGNPCVKAATVLPFGAGVQHLIDDDFRDGHRYYTKEAHLEELSDEVIDRLITFWKDMPPALGGEIEILGLGGAILDVAEEDTAFSNRNYAMWLNFAMSWDDPADDEDFISRSRAIIRDLKPWTGTGVYLNMLNVDELDRVVEAFGREKYARLGHVKAQYDPENLFSTGYQIIPEK
ncbi:FAD-binding oxidoreductase [Actinoplanes sp. NPDC051633]|uniref:FAD-binding oxidoreductase n=1 Tax=Actinoplanes sp. NPDC051633 TaxID=3155670 RepID=UPI00342F2843